MAPKLGVAFEASFVLAPNEKDEFVAAGAAFPNGDTFGGAELNPVMLVAFAWGTALNENADLVSVAAAAVFDAPNGVATFAPKLNADVFAALLLPKRLALPVFWVCDELPKTLFVVPNDEVPKAGAAAVAD